MLTQWGATLVINKTKRGVQAFGCGPWLVSQMIKLDTLTATSDTTDDTSERDCLRHVELGRGPAFLALSGHRWSRRLEVANLAT